MYMLHCHILEHEDDGMMTHFEVMPPITPTLVVSRKVHGSAGTFDIPLPLHGPAAANSNAPSHGTPGIECRSGGANNQHQIILTFPKAVTFDNASLTGTGTIVSATATGTDVTVNLSGVTNGQAINLNFSALSDGEITSDFSIPIGFLLGDTNGNGVVNTSDVGQTKSFSGQGVDTTNFRADLNVSGTVNATDIGLVKANAGSALPP
jgi:hypothetical protein